MASGSTVSVIAMAGYRDRITDSCTLLFLLLRQAESDAGAWERCGMLIVRQASISPQTLLAQRGPEDYHHDTHHLQAEIKRAYPTGPLIQLVEHAFHGAQRQRFKVI